MSFLPSIVESFHENFDINYAQQKKVFQIGVQTLKIIAAATLVSSAVTTFFAFNSLFSLPSILVSLPLCYISYNSYQIADNLHDIIKNPKEYQLAWGLVPKFNRAKIAKKLRQNTILLDWPPIQNAMQKLELDLQSLLP